MPLTMSESSQSLSEASSKSALWVPVAKATLEALSLKPLPAMLEPFFDLTRIKFVMGGERSGKSFHGALQLVCRHRLGTLFWLVAEEYETCVPEMEYIVDFMRNLDAFDPKKLNWPREGSKSLTTRDGILIETRSASDYRRVAEKAPDGIIGCEVGRWQWETFLRVSGRLAQKRAWAWLSGSFEGSLGWQAEKWTQWQGPNPDAARSWGIPTHTNTAIFPGGEHDPEIERLRASQPHDYFMERYMGVPVPPSGLVYPEFRYTTHVSEQSQYRVGLPVEVWIDPGYAGAYVVEAVQLVGDRVNVIDEVYVQRLTHSEVIHACSRRDWWKDIAGHGVIDVAGKQHQGGDSAIEVWRAEAGIYLDSQFVHIKDGIDRVHNFLRYDPSAGRPPLLVNPKCVGLIGEMGAGRHPIDGMGSYRYKVDMQGNAVSEIPVSINNHASSALAYGLVNRYGYTKRVLGQSANWQKPDRGMSDNYRRPRAEPDLDEAVRRLKRVWAQDEVLVH